MPNKAPKKTKPKKKNPKKDVPKIENIEDKLDALKIDELEKPSVGGFHFQRF